MAVIAALCRTSNNPTLFFLLLAPQNAFGALAAFDDGTKIEKLPEVVYVRLEALQRYQVRA